MSTVFSRPISYTKRLSLAAGYYIVISCSKWESLCIRNWSAKACYKHGNMQCNANKAWFFFINKDYKKSCEQMSLFPLVLWAYVLWAFVLWAFVLWAFVMESDFVPWDFVLFILGFCPLGFCPYPSDRDTCLHSPVLGSPQQVCFVTSIWTVNGHNHTCKNMTCVLNKMLIYFNKCP